MARILPTPEQLREAADSIDNLTLQIDTPIEPPNP